MQSLIVLNVLVFKESLGDEINSKSLETKVTHNKDSKTSAAV